VNPEPKKGSVTHIVGVTCCLATALLLSETHQWILAAFFASLFLFRLLLLSTPDVAARRERSRSDLMPWQSRLTKQQARIGLGSWILILTMAIVQLQIPSAAIATIILWWARVIASGALGFFVARKNLTR
jgi:hypothetical protein